MADTISERAMELRDRQKFHISPRLLSAINGELANARSKFPEFNGRAFDMLYRQCIKFSDEMASASTPDIHATGVVLITLVVRYLEECAVSVIPSGALDDLDKIAR